MKLISIATRGFKKLDTFEANFTSGLNVIVGDNAAGKSTLLLAIEASLYGASVLPGGKDHVTTWGKERWSLELVFEVHGETYTVTRTKSTAKLMKGDKLEANGSSPVTKHIENLLGLNTKDFNLFMQSKQGETAGVLTFGATALARKVEEFAGVSLLDGVQALANEEARDGRSRSDAIRPSDEALKEAQQALVEATEKRTAAEVAHRQAVDATEALAPPESIQVPEGDPQAMRRQAQAYSRKLQAFEGAKRDEAHSHAAVEQARKVLEETQQPADTESLERQVTNLSAEISGLKKKADALSDTEGEILRLRSRADEAKQDLALIEVTDLQFQNLDDAIADLDHAIESRRTERAEYAAQLKQLEKLTNDAECPTCGTLLTDHDPEKLAAEVAELKVRITDCDAVLKNLTASRKAISAQVSEARSALNERQRLTDNVEMFEASLGQMNTIRQGLGSTTIEEYSERMNDLRIDLAATRSELSKVEDVAALYHRRQRAVKFAARENDALLVDLEDAKKALETAEAPASDADIEALEDAITAANKQRQELRNALSVARSQVLEAKSDFDLAESSERTCRQTLERIQGDLEDAKMYEAQADKGARLSKFLRSRRSEYMSEVWTSIMAAATRHVRSATRGQIQSVRYGDTGFVFEEEGMLAPVECASGAQKAFIGVALRIGLSRALYGSDAMLIFDEPTAAMREGNAVGLSASLAGTGNQCLLITHREQDQDLAKNIIEVG